MTSEWIAQLPPAMIMMVGGLLLAVMKDRAWQALVLVLPLLTLAQVWSIPVGGEMGTLPVAGFELDVLHVHPFTHMFATVFCIAAFAGGLFALNSGRLTEIVAAYIYAGGAIGVTFAGDLLSFFIFWEVMAIASTVVIWSGGMKGSHSAGLRYIYMHLFGGVLLLCGIASHVAMSGDMTFGPLLSSMELMLRFTTLDAHTVSLWLILLGVLVNAGMPPFSAWLPDAYPESSPTGGVFLSAFTTKTAVFTLLVLFAGNELLLYGGLFMAVYGALYALLNNNMRRILSYGIIIQVGVMLAGIGVGTEASLAAVSLVAFGHVLYKGLLFMVAGSVIEATGKRRCSDLGMLFGPMKNVFVLSLVAIMAVALPLTIGYVGKSLLGHAFYDAGQQIPYVLITASTAAMLLILFKWCWHIFLGKPSQIKVKALPANMLYAMCGLAFLCVFLALPGVVERLVYSMLPSTPEHALYSIDAVLHQLEVVVFVAFALLLLLPMLKRTTSVALDVDWLYRIPLRYGLEHIVHIVHIMWQYLCGKAVLVLGKTVVLMRTTYGPNSIFARSWTLSTTVLWTAVLLGVYLVIYFSS